MENNNKNKKIEVIGIKELKKHKNCKIVNAEGYTKKHYKIDGKSVPNNMQLTIWYDLKHEKKEYFTIEEFQKWFKENLEIEGDKIKSYLWFFTIIEDDLNMKENIKIENDSSEMSL